MISAREALALPSAAVTPSDQEVVNTILVELDACVRRGMTRNGCTMEIDAKRLNPAILAEIGRTCSRLGWVMDYQENRAPSRMAPGGFILLGHQIALHPKDESYDPSPGAFAETMDTLHRVNGILRP